MSLPTTITYIALNVLVLSERGVGPRLWGSAPAIFSYSSYKRHYIFKSGIEVATVGTKLLKLQTGPKIYKERSWRARVMRPSRLRKLSAL